MERVACFQSLLLHVSRIPYKIAADEKRNLTLLSKALGKELPPCYPQRDPYGNRHPIPEPYLAHPSGFPAKEPSLQVPPMELPQREMLRFQSPPSFIFQIPRSTIPIPGSPDPSESPL
jgi:hypothetical protein